MQNFIAVVSALTTLSPGSAEALKSLAVPLRFKKGHLLLPHDSVCDNIFFVEKGLTRTFYFKDGKDITDWFSPENTFACSIVSFITRERDRRGIELLEDSELLSFSYEGLERLYAEHHDLERLGRLLVNAGVVQMQRRFDDLHFSTAMERYQQLLTTTPRLLQRVSLMHIASFLGITHETLSRMRARV